MTSLFVAFLVGTLLTITTTRSVWIPLFKRLGFAQVVRADGPTTHLVKRGRPTMGGIVFILCGFVAYAVGRAMTGHPPTASVWLTVLATVWMGALGFIDDYLKISKQNSAGLSERGKMIGQVLGTAAFLVPGLFWRNHRGVAPASFHISLDRDIPWLNLAFAGVGVGVVLVVIWVAVMAIATTNSVNFVDGLDGLLAGSAAVTLGTYTIICLYQTTQLCGRMTASGCYVVRDPFDLATLCAAMVGSLLGYWWYCPPPASIFMGDTGSMALGGLFLALAVFTRTELLFVLTGLLYVIIGASVFLQRYYFKLTKGKRLFRMAPLHHHFELKGWAEITITIRFWMISVLGGAAALMTMAGLWLLRR